MRSLRERRRTRGFTLAEMMVVVAIIAVGATMAIAVSGGFIRANRLVQAVRIAHAAVVETRSRAIATRRNTSLVLFNFDSVAVMTDESYEPIGEAVQLPEPMRFYVLGIYGALISPVDVRTRNTFMEGRPVMIITFFPDGSAGKNIIRAVSRYNRVTGAIYFAVADATHASYPHKGYVTSWTDDTISTTASRGWMTTGRGYAVIGRADGYELVSYTSVKPTASGRAMFSGVRRGVMGTVPERDLTNAYVHFVGFCGCITIVGATGQVIVGV